MKKVLTPSEAINAIYLDFEGRGPSPKDLDIKKLPHMAGIFKPKQDGFPEHYQCICFKEEWSPIANGHQRLVICEFIAFFQEMANQVQQSRSKIIFWSDYERVVLKQFLDKPTFKKIEPFLINLKSSVDRYYGQRKELVARKDISFDKLDDCFAAMYPKRKPFKELSIGAAKSCGTIDKMCIKNKKWKQFSEEQRSCIKDLIDYNFGDCKKTWLIAKKVSNLWR